MNLTESSNQLDAALGRAVPPIDDAHRKRLLRFLLVKTAAVRSGIKPAELLRVRHCYAEENAEGFRFCLYRRDIYLTLQLDYIELKVEDACSLVLFYNRERLAATLAEVCNRRWLAAQGYPNGGSVDDYLERLKARAQTCLLPHEVGVFIGYPLKDVVGFMKHVPCTSRHRGPWRIYGNALESLRRMRIYEMVERFAEDALGCTSDLASFFGAVKAFQIK